MVYNYKLVYTGVATTGESKYDVMIYNVPHMISVFAIETLLKKPMKLHVGFNDYFYSIIMHFHDNCFSSNTTRRVQR